MTPESPAWLARADSRTLADALATVARMAETPQLFEASAEHRPRFGALGLQTEDFAQRHSISSASDLAVFAAATLDQQDFIAEPPRRPVARALAGLYTTRHRWRRKALISIAATGTLVVLLFGGHSVYQGQIERTRLRAEVAAQAARDAAQADLLQAEAVLGELAARPTAEIVAAPLEQLRNSLRSDIESQRLALAGLESAAPRPFSALAPRAQAAKREFDQWNAIAAQLQSVEPSLHESLAAVQAQLRDRLQRAVQQADLATAQAALQQRDALQGLHEGLQNRTQVDALDGPARDALAAAEAAVATALADADVERASAALQAETSLKRLIATPYTVHIVDRPGELSGVPRYPVDNPDAAAYYLIVEAITADGQVLEIPVLNEETQQRSRVSKFGIRVSEDAFNAVRSEKQASGRIADRKVGSKPAGHLHPEYRIAASGGAITEW